MKRLTAGTVGLKKLGRSTGTKTFYKCSRRNAKKQSSSNGCYSNQNGQKRTKLDRNERKQFSRLQKQLNTAVQHKQITFSSNQPNKQSVLNNSKIVKQQLVFNRYRNAYHTVQRDWHIFSISLNETEDKKQLPG